MTTDDDPALEEQTVPGSEENEAGSAQRQLTDAEFAEATELYELGKAGLKELADQYGISRQALSKRFRNNGVVKGSRAGEVAAATKAAATAPGPAASAVIDRFVDRREEWIEQTRVGGYKNMELLERMVKRTIAESLKPGPSGAPIGLAAFDDELKAAERVKKIFIETTEHRLNILKADEVVDEDNLPNLLIEDLTDDQILEHHKQIGALPDDATLEDLIGAVEDDEDELDIEDVKI